MIFALNECENALGVGALVLIGRQQIVEARVTSFVQKPLAVTGKKDSQRDDWEMENTCRVPEVHQAH